MNSYLLNRSLGNIGPAQLERAYTTRLLSAIQPALGVRFNGSNASTSSGLLNLPEGQDDDGKVEEVWAHKSGVNALAVDKWERKWMLSGGADASIHLWDLESAENNTGEYTYRPLETLKKSAKTHQFGITDISFFPFDALAFLSSSYDHTLKIYSTLTLTPSASFDLHSIIYTHATSPIATHCLVACATQHPAVRLVDLRSGAATHSLAGHGSAVLSLAWHPTNEYVLTSGATDGGVRFWDIRRSAASLGSLDMEDSIGVPLFPSTASTSSSASSHHPPRRQASAKAHHGAVNALVFTPGSAHLLSAGLDERIRVWDIASGANTHAAFGPTVRNRALATAHPLLTPDGWTPPGAPALLWPGEREILVFDALEGALRKRLRVPGARVAQGAVPRPGRSGGWDGGGERGARSRVTGMAWRAPGEVLSAHSDGVVRAWVSRLREDEIVEEDEGTETDEEEEGEDGEAEGARRKRKRDVLEEVYRDLVGKKVTFT